MKARMMSTQEAEVAQQHKRGDTIIKIVSASYGASAGRRLLNGEIISSSTGPANAPYTRDVAPFIRALLKIHQYEEKIKHDQKLTAEESIPAIGFNQNDIDDDDDDVIRLESASSMFLPLMDDGKSMNAIFGDPCPGTSKQLRIHYVLQEAADDAISRAAASEVHRIEFSEHERVVLRRRVTFYQDESKLKSAVAAAARKSSGTCSGMEIVDLDINNHDGEDTLQKARRLGRAQSISDFTEYPSVAFKRFKLTVPGMPHVSKETSDTVPVKKWRLRSATSEIVLPIVMPFLEVRERVQCQLVCKSWRFIVRYYGVANTVDINDASFPTSRSFLRGIMAHSYASLQSLFLNDFSELTKDDLHPAIPNLRKLRSLDISRCELLDNSTLKLISQHLSPLLEVLYMKGLKKVTDDGLISICQQCTKLKVLEISKLAITDESGIAIGEHLTRLRALYMRDNYLLTNRSVDTITKKCTKLNQLTLWGSTRLQHLSFEGLEWGTGNLVLLNIWGCHSLKDEAAQALAPMKSLRSLIASECHRLTDAFVVRIDAVYD
jgi:hypothetical protein